MDLVKEDMADIEVTEEDTEDRNNWRWKISCGVPGWEKPKEEGENCIVANNVLTAIISCRYVTFDLASTAD